MGIFSSLRRCSSGISSPEFERFQDELLIEMKSPEFERFQDDLLIEILCRLPIKNLMQCKCVCRSWRSLISNICVPRISSSLPPISGFICRVEEVGVHNYIRREIILNFVPYGDPLCLRNAYRDPSSLQKEWAAGGGFVESCFTLLPFKPSPDDLFDVCNGLLLFVNRQSIRYYVCNPTTKQCVCIPKATFYMEEECFASLAFDPCESSHYKVVRFPSTPEEPVPVHQLLDIFSSETGRWVRHQIPLGPSDRVEDERLVIRRSCYLHGVLYRLALSKRLLCFNMMKMTRQAIALPETSWVKSSVPGFIGVSNKSLHYVNKDMHIIKVWVLDDATCHENGAGYNWIMKYSILNQDVTWSMFSGGLLVPVSYQLSWYTFNLHAIHPTSDIMYMGTPKAIFSLHLDSSSMKLYFEMFCNRSSQVASGEVYFFCHSDCYVVLNEFQEAVHPCSSGGWKSLR